jgi:hypothetical protein
MIIIVFRRVQKYKGNIFISVSPGLYHLNLKINDIQFTFLKYAEDKHLRIIFDIAKQKAIK